ncbi:flavin reductase family protein [Pseudoflavonifractor phocaeensis]|uniref:flavin reductase family protein n=1 Tax=Pseudoflavonifractor phocaeensis TaxID=1870988 RepID=UPI00195DBF43|nr:flavin reductase family protein [Pseudoflavonifractor phocaeensis]MBM6723507.1 flavin reductase family protein [Pseudoflavonifractor phocaeensis]
MFERIDPKSLDQNVFSMIGDQWMLLTAGTREKCNTMTASWGGLGVLWGKPVATVYIRPQRYTLEFVEREEWFTLAFFGEEYRKALALCGSKSGRDIDKVKECGFTVETADGAPYFAEADLVLVCRKAYWQDMDPTHFLDGEIDGKWYPEKDYHRIFIGEIETVLKKK